MAGPPSSVFRLDLVRVAVARGRVVWRVHALERMMLRGISRSDVQGVLRGGLVVEDYKADTPFPSALVLGMVRQRAIHVVAAWDEAEGRVYVISAYEPDLKHFEPNWRTRRRKS